MDTEFSVIVPVYNAEHYIKRGISCLLGQTYPSFEILVVDDGSTDGSGTVLDVLSQTDCRLRVFHKHNEGAGMARNEGLRHAVGKYVYFMDIDDVVATDFLEKAAQLISRYDEPDLLAFGFVVSDKRNKETVPVADKYIASRDELSKCYTSNLFKIKYGSGFLWNKVFRRDVIAEGGNRFCTFKVMEDELFITDYMKNVNTVCLCSKAYYTYFINNNGNSRSGYIPDMPVILDTVYNNFTDLRDRLNIEESEFDAHLKDRTFTALMNWMRQGMFHADNTLSHEEKREQLRNLKNSRMWQQVCAYESALPLSVESKLLMMAVNDISLAKLRVVTSVYSKLRCIINKFK